MGTSLGPLRGSKMPYDRVVATELLRLVNHKRMAHFKTLEHIVGTKVTNVKLHRSVVAIVLEMRGGVIKKKANEGDIFLASCEEGAKSFTS